MKTVVLNVKKLFEQRQLPRSVLGEVLHLSRYAVDDVFEGRKKLTLQQAHLLSEFLDTDLTDMLQR